MRGTVFKRLTDLMHRGFSLLLVLACDFWISPSAAVEFVACGRGKPRKTRWSAETQAKPERWMPRVTSMLGELCAAPERTAEPSVSAILHTAEFERSDPRLAGLMLRCGRQGIETVIVVVEPFPPHARPQITLRTPGQEFRFVGTIIPTGAGIRLPSEATDLVTGSWRKARELEIKVTDGDAMIEGVVALTGLPEALQSLNAECVQK